MISFEDLAIGDITGLQMSVLMLGFAIPIEETLLEVGLKATTPQQVAGYLAQPN